MKARSMRAKSNFGSAIIAALIMLSLAPAFVRAQSLSREPVLVPEWQKAAGGKLSFEVASIKPGDANKFTPPNVPLGYSDFFGVANPHGRFVAQFPLEAYIAFAYKLWPSQELREVMLAHSPKWVSTDAYVINAQAEGSPTKDQMRLMIQSLLAERFKLAVHFERQEISVLALVQDKPGTMGAKLYPHSNGPACDVLKPPTIPMTQLPAGDGFLSAVNCDNVQAIDRPNSSVLMAGRNLTMDQIAATLSQLSRYFAQPVVDQTGLGGRFDFILEWVRESNNPVSPDPQGTTIQEALQDQLGLKLKSTKASVETLVIDHVERPSEN
jgi:bla regulator protein BlaR1